MACRCSRPREGTRTPTHGTRITSKRISSSTSLSLLPVRTVSDGPRTHLCDAVALQQHLLVLHVVSRQLEHGSGAAELDLQGLRDMRRVMRRDRSRGHSSMRATISATSRQRMPCVLSGACATASGDTRNDSRPETCVLLWPAARFISMVTGLIAPFLSSGDSPSTTTCDARRPRATRWHARKRGDIWSRHLGHISRLRELRHPLDHPLA